MKADIIQKAAKAKFYRAHPEYPADGSDWEYVAEQYRQLFIDSATRTLTPVYADIQAEALLEASRNLRMALVEKRLQPGMAEASAVLRDRADELDGRKP